MSAGKSISSDDKQTNGLRLFHFEIRENWSLRYILVVAEDEKSAVRLALRDEHVIKARQKLGCGTDEINHILPDITVPLFADSIYLGVVKNGSVMMTPELSYG